MSAFFFGRYVIYRNKNVNVHRIYVSGQCADVTGQKQNACRGNMIHPLRHILHRSIYGVFRNERKKYIKTVLEGFRETAILEEMSGV